MATKVFCDKCGDESREGRASQVVAVKFTAQPLAADTTLDLCGTCVDRVRRFICERDARPSEDPR
jgi:hypothetical protein